MDQVTLKATARDTKQTAKQLRRAGEVPCVIYGNKAEHMLLQCAHQAIKQAYIKAGESTLVNLEIDGKTIPVLFHALEFDPVADTFAHVDFYAVDMNKEIETDVALHFEGESQAVKDGGILVTPMTHVTVRCLPKNLPHNLPVSLDSLKEMHAVITVKDIARPSSIEILDDAEMVIATVQEPRKEEEVVAAPAEGPAPAEGAAPGAEGAAAAAAPAAEEKKK